MSAKTVSKNEHSPILRFNMSNESIDVMIEKQMSEYTFYAFVKINEKLQIKIGDQTDLQEK